MRRIRRRRTAAVLVVNVRRSGVQHYVGPNAFAEIGVAFSDGRKVFLLHGMPESYADELRAWGVTCLNGQIQPLLQALRVRREINQAEWSAAVESALV